MKSGRYWDGTDSREQDGLGGMTGTEGGWAEIGSRAGTQTHRMVVFSQVPGFISTFPNDLITISYVHVESVYIRQYQITEIVVIESHVYKILFRFDPGIIYKL